MKEKRLYDSPRWRKLRAFVLAEEPLCRLCAEMGRDTPANTVDHIQPHKNNPNLFFDRNNLQSLCASCHSRHKRIQENSGLLPGCDINGFPIDPNHNWSKL